MCTRLCEGPTEAEQHAHFGGTNVADLIITTQSHVL